MIVISEISCDMGVCMAVRALIPSTTRQQLGQAVAGLLRVFSSLIWPSSCSAGQLRSAESTSDILHPLIHSIDTPCNLCWQGCRVTFLSVKLQVGQSIRTSVQSEQQMVLVWYGKKRKQFSKRCSTFSSFWHAKRFKRHRLSGSHCSWSLTFFHADIPLTSASFSSPVTEEKQDVFEDVFSSTDKHEWHLWGATAVFRAT